MYRTFVKEMQEHFPKVDQHLLLDIILFQTSYQDWDGSVVLKIVYLSDNIDLEAK
jgi:hypothetical protein